MRTASFADPVNILMVDDQPAKLLSYEAMLEELGENLIKANTAREALAHLLQSDIAVVLMDVSMPEIDGFELASMIRQHPRCQRTAIIFVSAIHMSDIDKVKGYETGAVDYVSVPVIPQILRAKIRVFIELHRKTAELTRLNNELEERVRARTNELEASLLRLQESETQLRLQGEALAETARRKDEFLAMLAHELRNPLAPIRNAVDLMRGGVKATKDLEWIRNIVDRQVTHLVRLVDDLLDASRISRGKMVLSRSVVELNGLIADAVESIRAGKSREHDLIVLPAPASIHVDADAVRLTQVFLNLLSNAIKFTPKHGRISLSVERTANHVDVRIKDTGQGIAADDLPHVFEMFYQGAESTGGDKGGLGLGLTLVEKLVQMHGGTVSGSSPGPGLGSEFSVRLPVVVGPRDADAKAADAPPPKEGPRRRVLVVDDNRDAVQSLAELLRLSGNEVEVAFDGEAAINAASQFQPDIVLLDIGMPIVDGYTAARTIRRDSNGRGIFLIAMTGWGQEDDKTRAMEAGFNAHLVKPVSIDAVVGLISSVKTGAASLPEA
jgi:signal transduction histidine kinase